MANNSPTYFLIQSWCVKFFGVDLYEMEDPKNYQRRRIINIFIVSWLVPTQLYAVYVSLDDIDSLCHLLGLLIGVWISFVKLYHLHAQANHFVQLNKLITALALFVKLEDCGELVSKNKLSQTFSFVNLTCLITSTLTLILYPLGKALFQYLFILSSEETMAWPTPFNSTYPFEVRGFTRYFLIYTFITYSYVVCCLAINGVDSMFVEASLLLTCHFRVLQKNIEKLDYEKFQEELREIFKYHRNILIVKDALQKSYDKILPSFMVFSSAMFGAFIISALRSPGLTVLKSLGYAISSLCQISFYTYGGSKISEESVALVNSYYNSNWYTAAPKKRKDICTAMILGQAGTKIKAGLFELNLNTFTRILSSTFSLITMLASVFD